MQEQSVKNWPGPEDSKDDFWAAIRTNYDFIMDTNLIDTCKVSFSVYVFLIHHSYENIINA